MKISQVKISRFDSIGHVTKHMQEFLLKDGKTDLIPINSQMMLYDLKSAVDVAAQKGIKLDTPINVNGWELVFRKRPEDRLPVLMHENPIKLWGK